jgi:hypothetical protein
MGLKILVYGHHNQIMVFQHKLIRKVHNLSYLVDTPENIKLEYIYIFFLN